MACRNPTRPPRPAGAVPRWLRPGVLVEDARTGRPGVVAAVGLRMGGQQVGPADRVWLRPAGGGREWTAAAADLTPVAGS